MFIYKKQLQFPIKIATPNPKLASIIISQYGGPKSKKLDIKIPGRDFFRESEIKHEFF